MKIDYSKGNDNNNYYYVNEVAGLRGGLTLCVLPGVEIGHEVSVIECGVVKLLVRDQRWVFKLICFI